MSVLAGTKYVSSGKFKAGRSLLLLLIGMALALLVGVLYGLITSINPIIYLNFLVLGGAVLGLVAIVALSKTLSGSRNTLVNILSGIIICYTAWHAHWCFIFSSDSEQGFFDLFMRPGGVMGFVLRYTEAHQLSVGRFGSSGLPISGAGLTLLYFIEFIIFMVPVYFAAQTDYYCEESNQNYKEYTTYIENAQEFHTRLAATSAGHYGFLGEMNKVNGMYAFSSNPEDKPEIIKIAFHYCEGCAQNSIIDISTQVLRYGEKKKVELAKENKIVHAEYVDDKTNKALRAHFGLTGYGNNPVGYPETA
jgi:hypothetical protein